MLERFYGLVYLSAVLLFVTRTGTQAKCPVQFSQKSVVVEYGGSVAVNCTASVPHYGMGWEASEGGVDKTSAIVVTWRVSDLREWDIKPFCYINYDITHDTPCEEELPVTVYKTPDSVTIGIVNHRGPMKEGKQYELQCDVQDVAPVQNLTVKWYKGQTLLDQTTFTDTSITPVNEVAKLLITADRADDGAQYRCKAELNLGAEGPQPPPTKTSKPLNAEVNYKPKHSNSTETIVKNNEVTLDCTVKAKPAPTYTWHSEHLKEKINSPVLLSSKLSPGNYTCTATNSQGSDRKVFIVQQKDRTTFWAIVISGVVVAVALIVTYLIYKFKCSKNSII
ncbi:vascular cell adhesion protein 1-like [Labeo rohita]|uniref:vascular cell adhesion protein 1-like n=1 Tax=Labeo rohita TaxID=84645 RepID=UPI0021E2ED5D|nr:vascular cell adhesion protein 1-like [Labeo rohita]